MTEVCDDLGRLSCESDDDEECLRLLLGGISTLDLSPSAWELESDTSISDDQDESTETATDECQLPNRSSQLVAQQEPLPRRITMPPVRKGEFEAPWFSLAYKVGSTTPNGFVGRPSVRVVDLSLEGRGNALIATSRIRAGDVIYTERAAVATQVLLPQKSGSVHPVRACQFCFRSLEPSSSCQISQDATALLPSSQLWPVPDIVFEESVEYGAATASNLDCTQIGHEKTRRDKYGRVQCQLCESWFCCKQCHVTFESQHNSCCLVMQVVRELPILLKPRITCASDLSSANDEEENADAVVVQPAIPLAIRMFATLLHQYRTVGAKESLLDGLCGEASDVTALELGVLSVDVENNRADCYSLEPVYTHLLQIWCVSLEEQKKFSLEFFMTLTANAARNGFGIRTQSPFKPYYAALLRTCVGGRGSDQHEELKGRVARALGSEDGNLERGMDRKVEAKVCPEIVALYPLTARINHACGSAAKAEVRSQEFVDHHIDVVALRDIECGDEITISYIHSGRKSGVRRRRELLAKYLFHCDCQSCRTGSSLGQI